jgi:hypothetical protein
MMECVWEAEETTEEAVVTCVFAEKMDGGVE